MPTYAPTSYLGGFVLGVSTLGTISFGAGNGPMPEIARLDFVGDLAIRQGKLWRYHFRLKVPPEPAAPFVNSGKFALGDFVTKVTDDGTRFLVTVAGTAAASEPAWPTVIGGKVTSSGVTFMKVGTFRLLDTTGYTAEMDIRSTPESSTTVITLTTGNARVEVGYDPPRWLQNTVYGVGQQVVPTIPNGWIYQCAAAGTSHASTEPTWPTALGVNVTDNTVTWRCERTDDVLTNLRLVLAPTDTIPVAAFGNYYHDLELTDTYGRIYGVVEGFVSMVREVSR